MFAFCKDNVRQFLSNLPKRAAKKGVQDEPIQPTIEEIIFSSTGCRRIRT